MEADAHPEEALLWNMAFVTQQMAPISLVPSHSSSFTLFIQISKIAGQLSSSNFVGYHSDAHFNNLRGTVPFIQTPVE